MSIQDFYDFPVAVNPDTGDLQPSSEFQVFATTDVGFTTPLAVTEPDSGAAINPLRSSSIGVLPQFRVAGDPPQVIIRSGPFTTLLASRYGILTEAGWDPALVDTAIQARNDAVAAKDALEAVPATNDGIMTVVASDPESGFAQQLTTVIDTEVTTRVPGAVSDAIAEDSTVVDAAAAAVGADIAGRDLVQRADPGIARVKVFENDEYARAWGGGAGLGRVFGGFLRAGGWFKFPRGFNYGNRRVRMASSDQFLSGTVIGARVAEDAIDRQGNVPLAILMRWGARLMAGGAAALAAWPFQPRPTVIVKRIRQDGTGDFTTLTAATAACMDGSPSKRYHFDIGDGIYVENKIARDASYIEYVARHPATTRIVGYLPPSATDTQVADASTFDLRGTEIHLRNLTVTIQNGRYAVHPELNGLNPDSSYSWDNCHFEHLGNDEIVAWRAANPGSVGAGFDRVAAGGFAGGRCAIGEGTASGASVVSKNATIKGASTYFLHDNSAFVKPSYHRFERTKFVGTSIMILNPIGAGLTSLLEFIGCRFDAERIVFQDSGWKSTATDQPASHYELEVSLAGSTPVGATFASMRGRAFKIESAATTAPSSIRIAGTAADAVCGAVRTRDGGGGLKGYAWGYKDISGLLGGASGATPLVNTIGKLLGDCSTVAKTLSVSVNGAAAIDVVFNTDMTAVANATILGTINTALGAAATASEYAVDQGETYPRTDHEAVLLNDGTVGIPRWSAVKYGGNRRSGRLVTTSDTAAMFVGVALEPIPPGSYGRVLLRGKLLAAVGAEGQIAGLTALTALDTISLSGAVDGQFVIGTGKPVGVASDTNIFAFNV